MEAPGIVALVRLAHDHARATARLQAARALTDAEAAVAAGIAAHLRAEVGRRALPPSRNPEAHLGAARAYAEARVVAVPPSGHAFPVGPAVTAAKRCVARALHAAQDRALEAQCGFNAALVAVLDAVARRRGGDDGAAGDAALARLVAHPGARPPTDDDAARDGTFAPILARQRWWNVQAVAACAMAVRDAAPELLAVHRCLARMTALGRPTEGAGLPPLLRRTRPLWLELFRRQEWFDIEVERTLGVLLGVPWPAEDGGVDGWAAWCAVHEPRWEAEARTLLGTLRRRPLLSIVVPTWRTPEPLLRACVDSVLAQSYPHWELCIADDGSADAALHAVLAEYGRRDPRIRIDRLPDNRGIAGATNAAIAGATGEWVGFLDHDDVLAPYALAYVAAWLDAAPATDVLYSDEDRIDAAGRRVTPFFKPGWSPDLLRSVNYVCHFLVVRRTLLDAVDGLRAGFDGSQDFDLVLRLAERTDRVAHIPRVLYHWRAAPGSTAADLGNKPAATGAGVRALREHLARRGLPGEVEDPEPTRYRVRPRVAGTPDVTVVVPVSDGTPEDALRSTEDAVAASGWAHRTVMVVRPGDAGGARTAYALRNAGAARAQSAHLLFLAPGLTARDTGWLVELLALAQDPGVGAVGATLLHVDGTIREAGLALTPDGAVIRPFAHMTPGSAWTALGNPCWTRDWLAASAACLLVRRDDFVAVGGFPSGFPVCGDVALGVALHRQGRRVVVAPHAVLTNDGDAALPDVTEREALARALRDWRPAGDPYWNPNADPVRATGRPCGLDDLVGLV